MGQLNPGRLHAFDALRGIMMTLGIVLHAAIPYATLPVETFGWELRDQQRHLAFDVLIVFIHSFRIPLFFLLSGFFMHLVLTRKGGPYFVRGRIRRILVPFVIAFLVLAPLVEGSVAFAIALPNHGWSFALAVGRDYLLSGGAYSDLRLMHLWFLYYLLLIYAVALVGLCLLPRMIDGGASRGFVRGMLLPVLALSPALLYQMTSGSIDTPLHLLPLDGAVLLFYLMWLLAGWELSRHPEYLETVRRKTNLLLVLAMAALVLHLVVLASFYSTPQAVPAAIHLLNATMAGVVITCSCFGILGAFAKLFPTPNRVIHFLGESSYWSYLVHLPIVILVVAVFQLLSIPAVVKYLLVVTITSVLTLGSYGVVAAGWALVHEPGGRVLGTARRYLKPAADPAPPR
jgi:glucans biosynthesis protein C